MMEITQELGGIEIGPALCTRLAELTAAKASVPNLDTVGVLEAFAALGGWVRALMLEWVIETVEAGPAVPDPCKRVPLDEGGVAQVRYAMRMCQGRASRECGFAVAVLDRNPALGAAMRTGRLDEGHAKVFIGVVEQLSEEARPVVIAALLPTCMDMTLPQLQNALLEQAMAIDPAWAKKVQDDALVR